MEASRSVSNGSLLPRRQEEGEKTVLRTKLIYAIAGGLGLIVASGATYKAVTGDCPVGALCNAIHGKPTTEVKVSDKTSN
jgi:hypothetical protein